MYHLHHPTNQRKAGNGRGSRISIISHLKLEISHHRSWLLSLEYSHHCTATKYHMLLCMNSTEPKKIPGILVSIREAEAAQRTWLAFISLGFSSGTECLLFCLLSSPDQQASLFLHLLCGVFFCFNYPLEVFDFLFEINIFFG